MHNLIYGIFNKNSLKKYLNLQIVMYIRHVGAVAEGSLEGLLRLLVATLRAKDTS